MLRRAGLGVSFVLSLLLCGLTVAGMIDLGYYRHSGDIYQTDVVPWEIGFGVLTIACGAGAAVWSRLLWMRRSYGAALALWWMGAVFAFCIWFVLAVVEGSD